MNNPPVTMAKHRFEIAVEYSLTREHGLQPGKDFTIEPDIRPGKNKVTVTLIGRDKSTFEEPLKKIAKEERFTLDLQAA